MRHVEIMTKSVEDLIGPLNEIGQKYAPWRLWVGGDPSIFAAGRITSVVDRAILPLPESGGLGGWCPSWLRSSSSQAKDVPRQI